MKKKIFITIALLITNFTSALGIIDTEKITIQQAVNIASKSNLDIQSSRLNKDIEINNIKSANRLQNPDFGVFYNLGNAGKDNPQEISFTQMIELGKRGARKKLAQSVAQLTERNIEYLEVDLRMDVREAYTNLLAKKSVLSTFKDQEDFLTKMVSIAKERYNSGKIDKTEVLQSQLLLNQIKTEVNSAKYDVKTALYEFNKVINRPEGFFDTIEDNFTKDYRPLSMPAPKAKMPEFEKISNDALNNRIDIKIALQEIEVAEKNLIVVAKQKIPDFEIESGYSYQNPGQSNDGTFKHGSFVGASLVNIPLFYNYAPEIKNAKLKLEQAKLNYASVENKALNDLQKAYEKFLTAQVNLNYYNDELLANSENLIQESRKNYLAGKTDLTTLITMEESYRMIIIAHTYALADYYNAWNYFVREVNNENFKLMIPDEEV